MTCQQCEQPLTRKTQKGFCSRACWYTWRSARSQSYRRAVPRGPRDHQLIAERVLGHPLPLKAVIHHTGTITDNGRIVICEDQGYHMLLHARARVVKAGGDPNRERHCSVCRGLKPLSAFVVVQRGANAGKRISTCRSCRNEKRRAGLWT